MRPDQPVCAIVQARMSSRRFPGKVLAPFRGRPVILHVLDAVARALPDAPVMVATSTDESDDPLDAYLRARGVDVRRGPLDDVFERFRQVLADRSERWVLRVCADSPLIDPGLMRRVVERAVTSDADIVTTTQPRTFPKGQSPEVVRVSTLMEVPPDLLTAGHREHVTSVFYEHGGRYRVVNVIAEPGMPSGESQAIDSIEDLHRLEAAC